jgi:hypothetical protein
MMHKLSYKYIIAAVSAGFIFCFQAALAAQAPVIKQVTSLSGNEDSAKWRRDPFMANKKNVTGTPALKTIPIKKAAAETKKEQEIDIDLQGIMQSDNSFHALINGRNVKTGDTIDGITIKEISRFNVVGINERKEKVIYDIYQGRIDRGKK